MNTYNKARLAHSRMLIEASLDGMPYGCDRCELLPRCSALPANAQVLCELSDELAGVDPLKPVRETTGNMLGKVA